LLLQVDVLVEHTLDGIGVHVDRDSALMNRKRIVRSVLGHSLGLVILVHFVAAAREKRCGQKQRNNDAGGEVFLAVLRKIPRVNNLLYTGSHRGCYASMITGGKRSCKANKNYGIVRYSKLPSAAENEEQAGRYLSFRARQWGKGSAARSLT
jgi:hypothetical protein